MYHLPTLFPAMPVGDVPFADVVPGNAVIVEVHFAVADEPPAELVDVDAGAVLDLLIANIGTPFAFFVHLDDDFAGVVLAVPLGVGVGTGFIVRQTVRAGRGLGIGPAVRHGRGLVRLSGDLVRCLRGGRDLPGDVAVLGLPAQGEPGGEDDGRNERHREAEDDESHLSDRFRCLAFSHR